MGSAASPAEKLKGKTVDVLFYEEGGKIQAVINPDKAEIAKHRDDGILQKVVVGGVDSAEGGAKQSYLRFIKQMTSMLGEPYYEDRLSHLDDTTLKKEYLRLLERMWERWRMIRK